MGTGPSISRTASGSSPFGSVSTVWPISGCGLWHHHIWYCVPYLLLFLIRRESRELDLYLLEPERDIPFDLEWDRWCLDLERDRRLLDPERDRCCLDLDLERDLCLELECEYLLFFFSLELERDLDCRFDDCDFEISSAPFFSFVPTASLPAATWANFKLT